MQDTISKGNYGEDPDDITSGKDWVSQTVQDTLFKALEEKIKKDNLSEEESNKFIRGILKSGIVEESYNEVLEMLSNSLTETMESTMYEHVLEARAYTAEFLARQEQKWGKAFVASEALYLCVLEATENYNSFVAANHTGEENYTYFAIRHLHGRALQIYKEILCLNQNGFADGAFARWRSLYELSVVVCFICKYGETVAQAYINSMNSSGTNEWARIAPCFANKKPREKITLQELIDNSGINEEWRSEYRFANLFVHSSADATFHRLGAYRPSETSPVGHTDWGMTISAVYAANSLTLITVEMFALYPHGDSIAAAKTFFTWINRIESYYEEVEKLCFPDT